MAKRAKLDQFSVEKDRLSALPDSILEHILARLPSEEAARSCILSRRWRHTRTPVMEFCPKPDIFDKVENMHWRRRVEWHKAPKHVRDMALAVMREYADRVNRAINNNNNGCILVRFCLHFPWSVFDYMKSWLNFALGHHGVEELELKSFMDPYDVGTLKFDKLPSAQIRPSLFPKLRILKSLTLCFVPMTAENLEHLLLKCVFLERLHLQHLLSKHCEVRISSCMPRLKYVHDDGFYDWNGMSIVVSVPTPDLVSLRYSGCLRITAVEFGPQLKDLSISGSYKDTKFDLPSHPLISYVSQLQSLHLDIHHHWSMVEQWLPRLPDLSGLKRLTLTINYTEETAVKFLGGMVSLINAAHCLQHLTLDDAHGFWLVIPEESGAFADLHVQSLRVIEFVRFRGKEKQRQLVQYMVKGVASLRQLILDSRRAINTIFVPAYILYVLLEAILWPSIYLFTIKS